MIRRYGDVNGFWGLDDTTREGTATNGVSRPVYLGQSVDQLCIFVDADNATTITVQVAHDRALTVDGNNPDVENPPATFHDLYYDVTATNITLTIPTGGGQRALILRDFAPGWVRLKSSGAVNILAGSIVSGL